MKKVIIRGDPGIGRGAVIEVDGEEVVCFSLDRQSNYHGADRPQLRCTVGTEDERDTFEKREFVPHFLDVVAVDAEAIDIIQDRWS